MEESEFYSSYGDYQDIWFELVDESNATKTYENSDFGKILPFESPIVNPTKLRIYFKGRRPVQTTSQLRDTYLKSVSWSTNDPKSWSTGTRRIIRDNHFAEELKTLGYRNFSDPKTNHSTVGFRLVQRP
jgi:hypothetical protein